MNLRFSAVLALAMLSVACGSSQPTVSARTSEAPTSAPTIAPTVIPTRPPTVTPTATTATPTATQSAVPSATAAAPTLLLEVTTEGGFIAPSARLGQPPTVVVDTAGNIYTRDPNTLNNPLITPIIVRNVGPAGLAQIVAAIHAAGVDKSGSDGGIAADAGVTVFTSVIDGQENVYRVAAGGGPGPVGRPGGSPRPADALLSRLTDPNDTWGTPNATPSPFTPTAYKVYVAPGSATATAVTWPLTTPLADFGTPSTPDFGVTGLRSGVVFGADAGTLASATSNAEADTSFVSGGKSYQVWIRALLPPELNQQ